MNLDLDNPLASLYKSPSQKVRILTENWVEKEIYCPNCGNTSLNQYSNNKPVADFFCKFCREDFELKSKKNLIGDKILDGAYQTMLMRLGGINNPNFFLLNYDLPTLRVLNFFVIPKHFFTPDIIEKRKPLSPTARRAGWVGCNILLRRIPKAGRIFLVRNRLPEPKSKVISTWRKTLFLREENQTRGWLLDIMQCIDGLQKNVFLLKDVYAFEAELSQRHPENRHIKDKIRQQLQILRDRGYLEFLGNGEYALVGSDLNESIRTERPLFFSDIIPDDQIDANKKFKDYLPVYDLQAAATSFKEQMVPEVIGWKPVTNQKLNDDMFIAQVIGQSMEPTIKNGSWCIFRFERGGSRNGLIVLVESQLVTDPETQQSFTIKRYKSEKEYFSGGEWRHKKIILSPDNKTFENIILKNISGDDFRIVAEFIKTL